jgi:biofilm protein TabA
VILDHLRHFGLYLPLHPLFTVVAAFLSEPSHAAAAPGEHVLGRGVRCIVATGMTVPTTAAVTECHRAFIDVHVPLEGTEVFGVCRRDSCIEGAYDADRDVALLDGPLDFLTVSPQHFIVFLPDDGHRSMLQRDGREERVRKLIFKVPLAAL